MQPWKWVENRVQFHIPFFHWSLRCNVIHFFDFFFFQGSQNPASNVIYIEVVDRVEKWSRFIHFVMLKVSIPCFVLPKYIVCFYLYFTTDMGNDAFELPLPIWWAVKVFISQKQIFWRSICVHIYSIRFPFDWKNPVGFLMTAIIAYALFQHTLSCATYMVCYGIGMNFYIVSLIEDIKCHLNVINNNIRTEVNRIEISNQISEYLQLHSDSTQLSSLVKKIPIIKCSIQ